MHRDMVYLTYHGGFSGLFFWGPRNGVSLVSRLAVSTLKSFARNTECCEITVNNRPRYLSINHCARA
jgi:hypothetical protein